MTQHDGTGPSPSEEMYLKTLHRLAAEDTATGANLARALNVSASSVSSMLRRFEKAGWIEGHSGPLRLTSAGETLAVRTIRRHRLAERLLTDVLKVPWEDVHQPACALEHAVSDVVADHIDEALHHPDTCPHGHPIPTRDGTLPEPAGVALTELSAGEAARVLRVSREDPDLLSYLGALGLVPGTSVTVEQVAPFGGPMLVRIGRARYALGRDVAGLIAVAPREA